MKKQQEKSLEETIKELAEKDYKARQNDEKSFELLNFLKDQCFLGTYFKSESILLDVQTANRISFWVAWMKERNILLKAMFEYQDTKNVKFSYRFNIDDLNNYERRRLNEYSGVTLEFITEDEKDRTYDHMFFVQ